MSSGLDQSDKTSILYNRYQSVPTVQVGGSALQQSRPNLGIGFSATDVYAYQNLLSLPVPAIYTPDNTTLIQYSPTFTSVQCTNFSYIIKYSNAPLTFITGASSGTNPYATW